MSAVTSISARTDQLTLCGVATAVGAADLRRRVGVWLDDCGVSAVQTSDVLMGVNEALANCVDHAYSHDRSPGTMTVRADFEPSDMRVSVCITDHGTWRQPGPHRLKDRRGRGVALMHALADHCTINGRRDGTTVCLDYHCR